MSKKYYLKNRYGNIQIQFLKDKRHTIENPVLKEVDTEFIKNYNNNFLYRGTFNIVGTNKFVKLVYQSMPEVSYFLGMFEEYWDENFSGYITETR